MSVIPGPIPMYLFDVIGFVLQLLPLIAFVLCFYNQDLILYLHYFLSQQIITIYFPYVVLIAGNCIIEYFKSPTANVFRLIFDCLYMVCFFCFLIFYMILTYIDNNTIISPNKVTGEWFIGFTVIMPVCSFIVTFISLQSHNLDETAFYIIYSIVFSMILMSSIYCAIEMPMLHKMLNAVIVSINLVIMINLVLEVLKHTLNIEISSYYLLMEPVVFVILFHSFRLWSDIRRIDIQQYLDQLDDATTNESLSSISPTLESLQSERQLRLLIYEGLQSGNKTITSRPFVQFCLEKFPRSSWMVSYVSLLCAFSWGADSKIYKFLLHTLSLDYFGIRNMHIFQTIYCLMQSSETLSPSIGRDLDEYRCEVLQFASIHRNFWRAVISSNESEFHNGFYALHYQINKLHKMLRIMSMKYPYASSIASENALFFADMKHNYIRSSECYSRAVKLLNPKRNFITDDIFFNYSSMFPISMPNTDEDESNEPLADELKFISLIDNHEHALRYMTVVSSNDEYLQALSHAFSVPTNHQPVDITFDSIRTMYIRLTYALTFLLFFTFVSTTIILVHESENDRYTYYRSERLLYRMIIFRNEIHLARQDIRLLKDILSNEYNGILNRSIYYNVSDDEWQTTVNNLYNLSMRHAGYVDEALAVHKNAFYSRKIHNQVQFNTSDCDNLNCTFPYLYAGLHHIMVFMMNERDPNRLKQEGLIDLLDNYSIQLVDLCTSVFNQFVISHRNWMKQNAEETKHRNLVLMIVMAVVSITILVIYVISMTSMKANTFHVIKTIQPAMLKMISSQFDKLMTLEKHQKQVPHDQSLTKVIFFYLMCFGTLICAPGFLYTTQEFFLKDIIPANNTLKRLVNPSNITQFLSFTAAILESVVRKGYYSEDLSTSAQVITQMALAAPEGCLYYLYNTTCDFCYDTTTFYDSFSHESAWVTTYCILFLSLAFLICWAINAYPKINIGNTVEDVMKFVPLAARKSNPVLAKIMVGMQTPIHEISDFVSNIRHPVDYPEFFCIVFLDSIGNVINIKGEITKYFNFRPNHIDEVKEYIKNHTQENPSTVDVFFNEKRPLETRSVLLDDEKEISMTFSRKGQIFLIKDDSHHKTQNSRYRIMERLNTTVKDSAERRKAANFPTTVIALIEVVHRNIHANIVHLLDKTYKVLDTRYRRVVCVCEPKDASNIQKIIFDITSNYGKEIRSALHCGGSVSVLQSAVTIEKSRVFGPTFDEAKILLSGCEFGDFIQSHQFLELMGTS